jgi:hypothetical protein
MEDEERRQPQPGPVDEGKDGGMATRELAPELVEKTDEDDEDRED